uniref:Uncharacterized protein n=1 Tax=Panagrolaimus davidi TaxID=227884 RepID=A0A914PDA7_9BILA
MWKKEILDVFRRYTRLFICDKQAVKYYRNEIEKFSALNESTTKYWIDTIKYEINFGKLENASRLLECAAKAVIGKEYHFYIYDKNYLYNKINQIGKKMNEIENRRNFLKMENPVTKVETISSKPMVYFKNPKQQYLCFRRSFIQNLIKTADGRALRKLFTTCKFFYWFKQSPICYRLEICSDKKTSYCQESLYLNEKDINFTGLENLHVYAILEIRKCKSRNLLHKILPKIKLYNIRNVIILDQDLTIFEFFLLLSKQLLMIYLFNVTIFEVSGIQMDAKIFLKEIKNCPKIVHFEFINSKNFILCSTKPTWINRRIHVLENYQHETVYIENQILNIFDFQRFINYETLKNITLKNVKIRNENETEMGKKEIEEIIKAEVNPKNEVCIEIFD